MGPNKTSLVSTVTGGLIDLVGITSKLWPNMSNLARVGQSFLFSSICGYSRSPGYEVIKESESYL